MKKSVKIALGITGVLIALVVILCVVVFSILDKQKNADYYNLGTDKIVSIKSVIGVRSISGVSTSIQNGVTEKSYNYKSETSADDITKYLTYLVEKDGFIPTLLNENSDYLVYAKKSADDGKILIVRMIDSGFGYNLIIQKGEGTLATSG